MVISDIFPLALKGPSISFPIIEYGLSQGTNEATLIFFLMKVYSKYHRHLEMILHSAHILY